MQIFDDTCGKAGNGPEDVRLVVRYVNYTNIGADLLLEVVCSCSSAYIFHLCCFLLLQCLHTRTQSDC